MPSNPPAADLRQAAALRSVRPVHTRGARPWLALLALLATAAYSAAQTSAAGSFALRARAIYPVTVDQPGPIENAVLIVRDGRIAALGADLEIPPDLPLIDLRDEVICPGFVDAAGAYAGEHAGPESVSAAYHAADAFNTYGRFVEPLARGITTAHVDPGGHRLVSGFGAVVKLAGPPQERVLHRDCDLAINLGVFDPPAVVERPFAASSDLPIEPARKQRPDSRLGQFLELDEQIAAALRPPAEAPLAKRAKFDIHALTFREAWTQAALPLRIQVRRAADIDGAIAFARRQNRPAYLVGLSEGGAVAADLVNSGLPALIRVETPYRVPAPNLGGDPEAFDRTFDAAAALADANRRRDAMSRIPLAIAGAENDLGSDVRMAAVLARRAGLPPDIALAAITRAAAEIIGAGDRVGSLAVGMDADFLILNGEPLDTATSVRRVYVGGQLVFDCRTDALARPQATENHPPDAVVVKAGTIWVGDGRVLHDASLLAENGKIIEVGQRVAQPRFARVIDAGRDAFVVPGFIDAHGHLGLDGDGSMLTPDLSIHRVIGSATLEFRRVARAGVTTVVLSGYRVAQNGARVAAIKTYGSGRDEMIARDLAGVTFSLRGKDPLLEIEALRRVIDAARRYEESWKKYAKDLEEWQKAREQGKEVAKPAGQSEEVESHKVDPVTGTWEITVSGGPLPEPVNGTMWLKLEGAIIEGRMTDPTSGEEAALRGNLAGNQVHMEVDVDTPLGKPSIDATLDREDHMTGSAGVAQYRVTFEARRTSKEATEFKVARRRRGGKDGRPAPPKVDENLEPLRPLLAGRIPAVIEADTAAQISAAVKFFGDELKVPLVLVYAGDAQLVGDQIVAKKDQVGVVVPASIITRGPDGLACNELADLLRRGVRVAMQSDSDDGARNLPLMALYAVQQGFGGDDALRALTVDAAKMFRIDDRVGSLEPGHDADIQIYSGHPFDAGSRLERVLISGREVPNE